jgi:SET domain-containing protein
MHFITTRDVNAGEELCISYVDVKDDVVVRRSELPRNWYFDCACKRCEEELANLGQISFTASLPKV